MKKYYSTDNRVYIQVTMTMFTIKQDRPVLQGTLSGAQTKS